MLCIRGQSETEKTVFFTLPPGCQSLSTPGGHSGCHAASCDGLLCVLGARVCCRGAPRGAVCPCDRHLPAWASVSPGLGRPAEVGGVLRPRCVQDPCALSLHSQRLWYLCVPVSLPLHSLSSAFWFSFLQNFRGFSHWCFGLATHLRSRSGRGGCHPAFWSWHGLSGTGHWGALSGSPAMSIVFPLSVPSLSPSPVYLSFCPSFLLPVLPCVLGGHFALSAQDLASQQSLPPALSLFITSPVSAESLQEPGRSSSAWDGPAALLRAHTVSLTLTFPGSWVPHKLTPLGANLTGPHCLVASGC